MGPTTQKMRKVVTNYWVKGLCLVKLINTPYEFYLSIYIKNYILLAILYAIINDSQNLTSSIRYTNLLSGFSNILFPELSLVLYGY